mgnify:CR=1 FL=1
MAGRKRLFISLVASIMVLLAAGMSVGADNDPGRQHPGYRTSDDGKWITYNVYGRQR